MPSMLSVEWTWKSLATLPEKKHAGEQHADEHALGQVVRADHGRDGRQHDDGGRERIAGRWRMERQEKVPIEAMIMTAIGMMRTRLSITRMRNKSRRQWKNERLITAPSKQKFSFRLSAMYTANPSTVQPISESKDVNSFQKAATQQRSRSAPGLPGLPWRWSRSNLI